jgi:DNA-binding GntR family transcriptional regulator
MSLDKIAADASRKYRTTQAMVAAGLREAILSGTVIGGEQLRQAEIAKSFGVSRIPVREALRQLEGEGLVTFYPHRGALVTKLSYEEVREMADIRVALESLAIRRAIPNLAEHDLKHAGGILDTIDNEPDPILRWGELNWDFHRTLYAPANRPRLLALIKTYHDSFERYLRIHLALTDYKGMAQEEHRQLLEMCRQKDVESAVSLLLEPIERSIETLSKYLQH